MATMTAALYDGKAMQISEVARPTTGPGDAVIRVRAAGICGSDLLIYNATSTPEKIPAGHEVAGEVIEVGQSVDPSLKGRRVAVDTIAHGTACAVCWYCRMGQYRQCQNMSEIVGGGFAEYIKRKAVGCYVMPDNMSWEEGALVEPFAEELLGHQSEVRFGEDGANARACCRHAVEKPADGGFRHVLEIIVEVGGGHFPQPNGFFLDAAFLWRGAAHQNHAISPGQIFARGIHGRAGAEFADAGRREEFEDLIDPQNRRRDAPLGVRGDSR